MIFCKSNGSLISITNFENYEVEIEHLNYGLFDCVIIGGSNLKDLWKDGWIEVNLWSWWFKNPQNFEALSMVNLKLTLTLMILLQNEENITVGNPQNYWGLTWSYFIWHHTLFYILYNPLFLSLIVYSSRSCISLTGCTCNLLRLTIVIYYW